MVKHNRNIMRTLVLTFLLLLFCGGIWADSPILKIIEPPRIIKNQGGCHPLCKACYYNEKTVEILTRIETQKAEKLQEFESNLESLPQIYYERGSLFLAVKALKLIEEKEKYLINIQKKSDYIRESYKRNMSRIFYSDYLRPIPMHELNSNPTMREWYEKKSGVHIKHTPRPVQHIPQPGLDVRREREEEFIKRLKDEKMLPKQMIEDLERELKKTRKQ